MRAKIAFSIISVIVGLLISLYIPPLTSAQQMSQNSITKDISSRHIDGGGTLTLDVSEDLGLTQNEALRLVNALPAKETDGTGVTIELLKPVDSTTHFKTLIIRKVTPKHVAQLVEKEKAEISGIRFHLDELFKKGYIVMLSHTVLIEFYNTTKSRINLQDWQIRFTYGAMPDDAAMDRMIDRMSNVDDSIWGHRHPQGPKRVLSGNVSMSRQVDLESLNDPTKTQDEQLAAISDGTLQTGWDISEVPREQAWIEIYNATNENGKTGTNEKGWKYLIELRGEKQPPHVPENTIMPAQPTDDR